MDSARGAGAADVGVVALDLSLGMPMIDFLVPARDAAVLIADYLDQSPLHRLGGIVGFSSAARQLPLDELRQVNWDFENGLDLAGALVLAATLLDGRHGRVVVLSSLDFRLVHNGTSATTRSRDPLEAGREDLAAMVASGLSVDLLWGGDRTHPASAHIERCAEIVTSHGGFVARLDDPHVTSRDYLMAKWS